MGQPRLITAQLNRIQCGRQGWLQGPAFSCVIAADKKKKKMQERTVFEEKRLDWGKNKKKRWKRFQSISSKACPSQTWRKTSSLTRAWSIIIPALWSRSNCLLQQAGTSRCCCERISQRRKQTHWFVLKRKENNPKSCSIHAFMLFFCYSI